MDQNDINQEQQNNVLGGNVQAGVPQAQEDPALINNQHYLPRGDLTITSNISFVDSSVNSVTVPLVRIPALFQQTFDDKETNFTDSNDIYFPTNVFSPAPYISVPNIARYIGYIIIGTEINVKYQESIMICCQNYLDGAMEILPNGSFRYLNQRRDGTDRRYSNLCKAIYYSISSKYYQPRPKTIEVVKEVQALMQDIYDNSKNTSVYTKVIPYTYNGEDYMIPKSTFRRWATTIPWHALIYNSQSPLQFSDFIDLFFKLFSINQGKILRYDLTHSNDQSVQTIMPNFHIFVNLTPPNMISSEVLISTEIPQRFVAFIRYLMLSENNQLDWGINDQDDDDSSMTDDQDEIPEDAESIDEAPLAY